MDLTFIYLVLLFLAGATALNSFFVIRTAKMIEAMAPEMGMPLHLSQDTPLPSFSGSMISTGEVVSNDSLIGKPGVIIFTAAGCAVCEEKKPEILKAQQRAKELGVTFLAAKTASPGAAKENLNRTAFSNFMMTLDKNSFRKLNPTKSMPLYIFFNESGIVKASNIIGDENWTLFIEQITA